MTTLWKLNTINLTDVGSADSVEVTSFNWYAYDSVAGYRAEANGVRDAYQTFTFANKSEVIAYTTDSAFDFFFEADPSTLAWMQGVESDLSADLTAWQNRTITTSVSLYADSATVDEVDPF